MARTLNGLAPLRSARSGGGASLRSAPLGIGGDAHQYRTISSDDLYRIVDDIVQPLDDIVKSLAQSGPRPGPWAWALGRIVDDISYGP